MENIKIETQENKEEIKNMENVTTDTQEAEKEIINVEQSSITAFPTDEYSKKGINPIFSEEVIPYYDPSVLSPNSQELDIVNYYFKSVTCKKKDIENLLYEVIGYSLAKTAKLNKLIILKGDGRNGKSKIFRVLEAVLDNKCSHEHLEAISGSKAGSKSTVKKLERLYSKYLGRPEATEVHKQFAYNSYSVWRTYINK